MKNHKPKSSKISYMFDKTLKTLLINDLKIFKQNYQINTVNPNNLPAA